MVTTIDGASADPNDFLRRTFDVAADEAWTDGPGWLLRTPSLPDVWTLNQVRIVGAADAATILALADHHQQALGYRHVVVEGEELGASLEPWFSAQGWSVEREVLMALAGPPLAPDGDVDTEGIVDTAGIVDTTGIVDLDEVEMLALMRRWHREEHPDATDAVLDQLGEFARREGRARSERRFGIVDVDGPVALTTLRSDGTTAQVENVYTVAQHRRRGLARGLVTWVAAEADRHHDVVFIVADDDDWPKRLYASVGFRAVDRNRTFHQVVAGAR